MECHLFGFLKRGKPTPGMLFCLAARRRLSDLERRSASICTVVAGTCSPCPLNATSRSYLLGKVPFSSNCALTARCRLSSVKCDTPDSLLSGNAVQLYYLL